MSCFPEQARANFWVGAITARKRSECGFKPAPHPAERRCPFFGDLILKGSEAGLNPINRHEMRAPNVGSGRILSCAPAGYSRSLDRDSERLA
jgi:hypothetical protein